MPILNNGFNEKLLENPGLILRPPELAADATAGAAPIGMARPVADTGDESRALARIR